MWARAHTTRKSKVNFPGQGTGEKVHAAKVVAVMDSSEAISVLGDKPIDASKVSV